MISPPLCVFKITTLSCNKWHSICFGRWQHFCPNSLTCQLHSTLSIAKFSLPDFKISMAFLSLLYRGLSLLSQGGLKRWQLTSTAQNQPLSAFACRRALFSALFYSSCTQNHFQTWSNVIPYPVNLFLTTFNFLILPSGTFGHHCPTHADLHFWSKIVDGLQQTETKWWKNRFNIMLPDS